MSNIAKAFEQGTALIPFITCGDPSLEMTERLVPAMADAGADLIVLGIPFSDPTAEGPVTQESSLRALKNGATTDKIFDTVKRIREKTDIPLVFRTYANVVFSYGINRFLKQAARLSIDGLILPDVPLEEKEEFDELCRQYGLDFISFIAPSSEERMQAIAKEAAGFLLCSPSPDLGEGAILANRLRAMAACTKPVSPVPLAVRLESPSPEELSRMACETAGIVIGSAVMELCARYGNDCLVPTADYITQLKTILNS